MVPPGQPSKPRARENSVGRERWIASWGTFCVPKTKRLLLTFWKLKVNRKMCTMISKTQYRSFPCVVVSSLFHFFLWNHSHVGGPFPVCCWYSPVCGEPFARVWWIIRPCVVEHSPVCGCAFAVVHIRPMLVAFAM